MSAAWVLLVVATLPALPMAPDAPDAPADPGLVEELLAAPWSEEGLGGIAADLGAELASVYHAALSDGPATWALARLTSPSEDPTAPPELPAAFGGLELSSPGWTNAPWAPPGAAALPAAPPQLPAELGDDLAAAHAQAHGAAGAADGAVRLLTHAGTLVQLLQLPAPAAPEGPAPPEALVAAHDAGAPGMAGALLAPAPGHAQALPRDPGAAALAPSPLAPSRGDAARGTGLLPAWSVGEAMRLFDPSALLGWVAAAFAAGLLYHRIHHERTLDHPHRRALYEAVRRTPGCTLQDAARAAGLPRETALHHLRILSRNRVIQRVPGSKEVHLFPSGFDPAAVAGRSLLARRQTRAIASLVATRPGLTRTDLAQAAGLQPSTIHWHVSALVDRGLVEDRRVGARRELHPAPALLDALGPLGVQASPAPEPAPSPAAAPSVA